MIVGRDCALHVLPEPAEPSDQLGGGGRTDPAAVPAGRSAERGSVVIALP